MCAMMEYVAREKMYVFHSRAATDEQKNKKRKKKNLQEMHEMILRTL